MVITDMNEYRLELARKMGATRALDVLQAKLQDVQHELGMKEGFDVGLEMSGSPAAFRDMIENLCHGGKIAILHFKQAESCRLRVQGFREIIDAHNAKSPEKGTGTFPQSSSPLFRTNAAGGISQ